MPTTWYFDGSGTDRNSAVMALTGLAAADRAWDVFNQRWTQTLRQLGLRSWHTSDQVKRLRAASPRHPVPAPILNAAACIADNEFEVASFAIDKAALNSIREDLGGETPDAAQLCVRLCCGALGVSKADWAQMNAVRVLFDRNEPFIRWLKRPWQTHARDSRHTRSGWPGQIKLIDAVASDDHPGL
jgi:hypothetical protein